MKTVLSIITINYNNLGGLMTTVSSVKNQTWQGFEYIVIDGGSSDGSKEYLESQTQFLDIWVSEKDSGIYNAMNKGIKLAKGEYLLFLNSGDHLFNEKVLEQNFDKLKQKDLICFNLQMVRNGFSKIAASPASLCFSDIYTSSLPHPATFIKKELFSTVGLYDEGLRIVSDWKFFLLALFKFNCSYLKIDETIATFYLDGISSVEDYSEERKLVMKEYFDRFIFDYEDFIENRKFVNTNRFAMLKEMEKTTFGKKLGSLFLRSYVILFSKKKLNDVLNSKNI
ncbi:glycosyltransferase family 2 protein [Flavobacterium saccharophilum]|uniref:Glycosyltransferase involved in cell wall bisynthesis n=1 Tax=Flavobacterium saccharophilum TaxID=29534 RepID=A0A1M7K7I6_9FLAO|nr:glycosyltransferase family 2 protein [Flavobacterium saccharophilum]SHM61216.1 Glycosyltransferase involved in cell wall bisynthesis [Flavobacterium saccharophilum]